jgi:hypothetical protein
MTKFNTEINDLAPLVVDLVRIGNEGDGGYLIPRGLITDCDCLITFGISTEWSFEQHVRSINKRIKMHAVDRTSGTAAFLFSAMRSLTSRDANGKERFRDFSIYIRHAIRFAKFFWKPGIRFDRRWIAGVAATKKDLSISSVLSRIDADQNVLFKIDIEGAEYQILPSIISSIDERKLAVKCLAIEFHDTQERRGEFLDLVNSLRRHMEIVHLHGNNCVAAAPDGFPQVVEITFARIENHGTKKRTSLPLADLDSTNDPTIPDFEIAFY